MVTCVMLLLDVRELSIQVVQVVSAAVISDMWDLSNRMHMATVAQAIVLLPSDQLAESKMLCCSKL